MQVNRTGLGLIALFGLGGVAFLVVGVRSGDPLMLFDLGLIGLIWVLVAAFLGGYAILQLRRRRRTDLLHRSGLRGRARVLSAEPTGITVNEQPRMRLSMEVEIPGSAPQQVTRTMLVPGFAAPRLAAGEMVLPVVADPRNPNDFEVQW